MLNQINPFDIRTFPSFPRLKKRFLSYFPENAFKEGQEDICWNWNGAATLNHYSQIRYGDKHYMVHRMSYIIFNGYVTADQVVRHTCDNKRCVNPKHLILGTQSDNMIDCVKRNRQGQQKLTQEEVTEIKVALKKPYRGLYRKLAEKFNITQNTISDIKNNKSWYWLTI